MVSSIVDSSPELIQTVTGTTFDQLVLSANGPVVVEFMTYSCSHCQAIEPILNQVAETLKKNATFFRVNIAVDQDLSDSFEVQGTPTLIMFLDGNQVGNVEGPNPSVASLLETISKSFGFPK